MPAIILDGKKIAEEIKSEISREVVKLANNGITPGLAVILVGADPASKIYVGAKKRACESVGIKSIVHELPENTDEAGILDIIHNLNNDSTIHGILVQLPLPKQINEEKIISAIDPRKDVDCFHPENFGKMALGGDDAVFMPCTPQGVMELIGRYEIGIKGKDCVVIGRSNIVGKPMGLLLLKAGGTVTICHSKTADLAGHCQRADILVSAVGRSGLVTKEMVKHGAVVVDVGINRNIDGKIVGDVDFQEVGEKASAITPVPGGIGPMTIAQLLRNTINATKKLVRLTKSDIDW